MPSCTLLTTKDRRGRKQPASAGALNRTSKEKTAAVCGAMQCQCIVESISEEAAHQIGAFLRTHQAASHSGAFSVVGLYPCLVPCGLPLHLFHCCWTKCQASLPYNERIKRGKEEKGKECVTNMWSALLSGVRSEHARQKSSSHQLSNGCRYCVGSKQR